MTINIKHAEADRLIRQLSEETGETITEAVAEAVRQRLLRVRGSRSGRRLADELDEIALRVAAMPTLDERSPEEILGYSERGLPADGH